MVGVAVDQALIRTHRLVPPWQTDEPWFAAQTFLRHASDSDFTDACLAVIDNGGILNNCRDDLSQRNDLSTLTQLDHTVRVIDTHPDGNSQLVTAADLRPSPSSPIELRLDRSTDGSWRVRVLNGRKINFEYP